MSDCLIVFYIVHSAASSCMFKVTGHLLNLMDIDAG